MKRIAIVFALLTAAHMTFPSNASAQLSDYLKRNFQHRLAIFGGSSIPVGPFMQKTPADPNAGYANLSFVAGIEYTALRLNGGIGLAATLTGSTYSVSMLPGGATGSHYTVLSAMVGPRFEVGLVSPTPVSLYCQGQAGAIYSKSPDATIGTTVVRGGNDVSFGVSVGGGAVLDRVVDFGVRYFYTEARFGTNRLSVDPKTRIEGIQATVGIFIL